MNFLLVILCFAAVHLRNDHAFPALLPASLGAPLLILLLLLLTALHALAMHRLGHRIDRTGSPDFVFLADRLTLIAAALTALLFLSSVLFAGWLDAIRTILPNTILLDELIALSLPAAALALLWWNHEPIDRRLAEALLIRRLDEGAELHFPLSRFAVVAARFRHAILPAALPLTLILAWSETADRISPSLFPDATESTRSLLQLVGTALVLLAAPGLIRLAWQLRPLPDTDIARIVHDLCRRHNVRLRGPFLLPTSGTLVNAMILGGLRPFRYILFSDALLAALPPDELRAVAAHEVAHVRHHHLPWLATLFIASTMLLAVAISLPLSLFADDLPTLLRDNDVELASLVALPLGLLLFTHASRRFEWQADAFAAADASRESGSSSITPAAASAMSGALAHVAALNSLPESRFSFRHGSIAHRRSLLRSIVGLPLDSLPINAAARRLKRLALLLALALALLLIFAPIA